ncbi:wax ester/triacylglycerol synthase domain-containing protein [Patulibacter minatonensis]|uniref:wax ester/triacylglycerol synthase domain-containing protein n=1 Tax=Patulibacter minatonensis TaxID=298163 RepID=UPI00047CBB35|nr:wax ester/triacylglycerol synthase domain-containing protein [Patulibacter minatonensis]
MSTTNDTPPDWGLSDFNAMEAVLWRAEADPLLHSTVIAVEELDVAPEWTRFVSTHEWGSRMVPRFRQRVDVGRLGYPAWVTDARFELRHHVFRSDLDGGTWQDVMDRVAAIAQAPFDRDRAPWEATLITGLQDGRAAYVLKMHHAILDGRSGMQLFGKMHSRKREPTRDKPQPLPLPVARTSALVTAFRRDTATLTRGIMRLPGMGHKALRPDRTVLESARYVRSLRRVLGPVAAPPSPALANRSGDWRFFALDLPLPGLRAAARAADATLNDAYLAAVLGGFHRYHEATGTPIESLPIALPIAIPKPGDASTASRFAGARLAGPLTIADPAERMHAVGAVVGALRKEVALDAIDSVAPVLARLPGPLLSRLVAQVAAGSDVQVSNIPGIPDEDVFIAGAKALRFYAFGPLPGCAAMIVLVSHWETCCVTVNHDEAAIAEPETLRRCLAEAFDEVLALGGTDARAEVRR